MTLRNNRFSRSVGPIVLFIACVLVVASAAWSEEVEEGTVINAANLSTMLDKEFEGKTVGSMLTENIQWMIKEQGLTMTLRHSEEVPVDPRWIEATKKYSGDVTFDPETRMVSGYKAGLCFPNVSLDDPHVADKLMWNAYYIGGWPRGMMANYPLFAFLFIDGDKGLERVQHWALIRAFMKGRLDGEPVVGDGSIDFKQLLFAHYPYDIRGIGTFAIRYGNGKYDDSWAYLRTVRRTRRLSGGTWHDPIGGTDQLNDEIEIMSAFPTWYTSYKLLEKRWILAVAHSRWPVWDQEKKKPAEAFPLVDLENKPGGHFQPGPHHRLQEAARDDLRSRQTVPVQHAWDGAGGRQPRGARCRRTGQMAGPRVNDHQPRRGRPFEWPRHLIQLGQTIARTRFGKGGHTT